MKKWYHSKTYVSALASFAILILNTGYSLWDPETRSFREPTEAQIVLILGGIAGLQQTLEGRNKATEGIGDPSKDQTLAPVEYVEQDTPPFTEEGEYTLTATRNTLVKTQPIQSSLLSEKDVYRFEKGQSVKIENWSKSENGHIKINGEYYVFIDHITLSNPSGKIIDLKDPIKEPEKSQVTAPKVNKTPIKLPGFKSTFYLEDPIYPGSHFYWREALRNGSRMPYKKSQVDQIVSVSKHLDQIRAILGNRPMVITSWLRPDRPVDINAMVGGVRNSRHIQGDGVDFSVQGLSLFKAQDMIRSYCQRNGLGLGLGAAKGFIHIDMAGFRVWNY